MKITKKISFRNWTIQDYNFYIHFYNSINQIAKGVCDVDFTRLVQPAIKIIQLNFEESYESNQITSYYRSSRSINESNDLDNGRIAA